MGTNYVSVIASIIVFSSLLFPWWTLLMTVPSGSSETTERISVYTWQVATQTVTLNLPTMVWMSLWFGWSTFVLMLASGVVGFIGSIVTRRRKIILMSSGIFTIMSMGIFATGIQSELAQAPPIVGFPINLFISSQSLNVTSYYYYFDAGFWIALIGAVVFFVSLFGDRLQKLFLKPERHASQRHSP